MDEFTETTQNGLWRLHVSVSSIVSLAFEVDRSIKEDTHSNIGWKHLLFTLTCECAKVNIYLMK